MERLTIVWNEHFLEIFDLFWNSLVFWRSMSLFSLGGLMLIFLFKDSIKRSFLKEDADKHDRDIFRLFDLLMPENKLMEILDVLEKRHFYEDKSGGYVSKFCDSLKEESKQYVNAKIKKSSLAMSAALRALGGFIDKNFVTFPEGYDNQTAAGGRYPNPEIDGGGDKKAQKEGKFAEFEEELKILINSVRNNYKKYRSSIKHNLRI